MIRFIAKYLFGHYVPPADAVEGNGILKIPMSMSVLEKFLGDMSSDSDDTGKVKSLSTLASYCSAIKHAYKEKKVIIEKEMVNYMKDFAEGYKRRVAQKRSIGVMKNHEGKVGISITTFVKLSKHSLFASEDRSVFSSFVHLFMVLSWNLFARSCSVADLRMTHVASATPASP